MKRYIIKPEYIDFFGSDANAYTVITEYDIPLCAAEFEKSVDDVLDMLIELKQDGREVLYRFDCKPSRERLNDLISFESGDSDDFFPTDEDYKKAVETCKVVWDCYYTTVYAD